jgi:hypothetical protein
MATIIRNRGGKPAPPPPLRVAALPLAMKDDVTRKFKESLLHPRGGPWMTNFKVGTWRRIVTFFQPLGQTCGCVYLLHQPSAIDPHAGVNGTIKIDYGNNLIKTWAVDCCCLLLSGVDRTEDAAAIAAFKGSPGKDLADDAAYARIAGLRRPLAAAFSVNQEMYENPIVHVTAYCFAEAFFDQFGIAAGESD